jgi:hypothetical protein
MKSTTKKILLFLFIALATAITYRVLIAARADFYAFQHKKLDLEHTNY